MTPRPAAAKKRIGLIGLGLMGHAFAQRLLAADWEVIGYDLAPACRQRARQLGVRLTRSNAAVFTACDRVLLSLPTLRETELVLADSLSALRSGHLLLDTTTGEPEQSEAIHHRLAARGVRYLDATISGNSQQVASGDDVLTMVGGDAAAFTAARALLRVLTRRVRHVGPSGSGARMKLVTNLVLGLNRAALAEGLVFANELGVEGKQALDVLRRSMAYSSIMDTKGEKMLARDFTPQAKLSQHLKDVRLMLAASSIPLPLSETHRALLEKAETLGFGGADNSAVIEAISNP